MELSLEKGQLLNNLKTNIECVIGEKSEFINKLNLAIDNEDLVEVITVLESFEKSDITRCFEINEILKNIISVFNNELAIEKKIELIKSFVKIIPNIELSKINVLLFFIKLHLKDENINNSENLKNEKNIENYINFYNTTNYLIKEFITYYYKSIDSNSVTFLNEIFDNDEVGNNKFNEFNSKIFFECTQTFIFLQNCKNNNSNLSNSIQNNIKKCYFKTLEILNSYIEKLSGKYIQIFLGFNNSSAIYKNYANVCNLLITLSTISPNDFKLLNLSWKYLIRTSCSEKLVDNISKYFKLDEPITICCENIKTFFDKIVEFILNNNIKEVQLKRNITLIKFYLTHLHSLHIKHSNYISFYSIDETYPIFKIFFNLCLYIKYHLSILVFKYETFNEEQNSALASLNEVLLPIDLIFSHFLLAKDLSDTQKLNYILYFIRFSYVDININKSYEKILSNDGFYYSKLLQFDSIFRLFWQLSETVQQNLLNPFSKIDSSEVDAVTGDEIKSSSILYCYFTYIDKCPSNIIRHKLPSDDESNEILTLDRTIIVTLSLLPHYINFSLFNLWEKNYFSLLLFYENQIIQTILCESWCNIFKYLNNDIQINHIKQLYNLLILFKNTSLQNSIKTLLFKLIRINILNSNNENNNNNSIIKELFSITSHDVCSTEVENKLMILNLLNADDLYYRDSKTYKIALEIWEDILCPLLEHPDEKIALYAFKKCSLPIKVIQKYLDNDGILSLSPQEIKKLQDVSIVLLGNCKTAIQADIKEPVKEDEKLNAYLTFKSLESLIDISISLISEYLPENVIKILEIIDNWHFKVPYLKYELIPHVSIINFLSSCGKVDFTLKYINKASDYLVSLYHTYFDSSNWVLKHQAFLSITQFGVTTIHSELLKKIVTEPYQQQFINIVSGIPIFEKNKNINILYKEESRNNSTTTIKEYENYLENEIKKVNIKIKDNNNDKTLKDNKNENNENISDTFNSSNNHNNNNNNSNDKPTTEIQKCINSLNECIQCLKQIQRNDNLELIPNNEVFSLKLHIDNFTDIIKKQLNKN
ncbi:hypothetical protein U3516DRAFT_834422 [Neocallimastix sp. 'constans']